MSFQVGNHFLSVVSTISRQKYCPTTQSGMRSASAKDLDLAATTYGSSDEWQSGE